MYTVTCACWQKIQIFNGRLGHRGDIYNRIARPVSTRRSLAGCSSPPSASPESRCSPPDRSAAVGSRPRRSPCNSVGCRPCRRRSGRALRRPRAWRRRSAGTCCGLASPRSRSPSSRTPVTVTQCGQVGGGGAVKVWRKR